MTYAGGAGAGPGDIAFTSAAPITKTTLGDIAAITGIDFNGQSGAILNLNSDSSILNPSQVLKLNSPITSTEGSAGKIVITGALEIQDTSTNAQNTVNDVFVGSGATTGRLYIHGPTENVSFNPVNGITLKTAGSILQLNANGSPATTLSINKVTDLAGGSLIAQYGATIDDFYVSATGSQYYDLGSNTLKHLTLAPIEGVTNPSVSIMEFTNSDMVIDASVDNSGTVTFNNQAQSRTNTVASIGESKGLDTVTVLDTNNVTSTGAVDTKNLNLNGSATFTAAGSSFNAQVTGGVDNTAFLIFNSANTFAVSNKTVIGANDSTVKSLEIKGGASVDLGKSISSVTNLFIGDTSSATLASANASLAISSLSNNSGKLTLNNTEALTLDSIGWQLIDEGAQALGEVDIAGANVTISSTGKNFQTTALDFTGSSSASLTLNANAGISQIKNTSGKGSIILGGNYSTIYFTGADGEEHTSFRSHVEGVEGNSSSIIFNSGGSVDVGTSTFGVVDGGNINNITATTTDTNLTFGDSLVNVSSLIIDGGATASLSSSGNSALTIDGTSGKISASSAITFSSPTTIHLDGSSLNSSDQTIHSNGYFNYPNNLTIDLGSSSRDGDFTAHDFIKVDYSSANVHASDITLKFTIDIDL